MADISITTTAVKRADQNSKIEVYYSAGAITIGQSVYVTSASLVDKAAAGAVASAAVRGIALNTVSGAGQPVFVLTEGNLTLNAALTAGVIYVVSTAAGGIAPVTDPLTGLYVSIIGIATSTTNLHVKPFVSGVAQ